MVRKGKVGQIHKIFVHKGDKFCKVVFDVFPKEKFQKYIPY